ncbi:anaphase-promoting complex subunit 10 [Stemphylium lycopersici]|uniref:Anaphase-promoting complex subunit 10 n=1 Tax=Stemphylium lycopersici TaxID=183478 RepID=A0A364N412_STELY|nr:anaphase-promoting complex subunit 10 [Stemphylium lycopersici]
MLPSLRRRGQPHHIPPPLEAEDSDSDVDLANRQEEQEMDDEYEGEELIALEDDGEGGGEEDVEEDDEALASPSQANPLPNLDPPPPYLREISTLASWTVSSSKPGCSIPQLRHPNTNLFWQSDGPQPHYLNIHFFKLVRIVGLRLYLDFEQDESYTPTRIIFLAGSGMNDLQEWGEMRLESPRGWVWADFASVGDIDSNGSDDDEDEDAGGDGSRAGDASQRMTTDPSTLPNGGGARPNDASSDSENAAPHDQPDMDFHTPVQTQQQLHTPLPPSSSLDAHHTHDLRNAHQTPQNTLSTPTLNHTSTPTLPRPYPRAPFTSLSPQQPLPHARPAPRPRIPKMPVLRAHLVQIKILENHQNGKDTHLRGLQIFARNDEDGGASGAGGGRGGGGGESAGVQRRMERGVRAVVGGAGSGMDVLRRERRERRVREERLELGGGIGVAGGGSGGGSRGRSRGAWDMDGGIR